MPKFVFNSVQKEWSNAFNELQSHLHVISSFPKINEKFLYAGFCIYFLYSFRLYLFEQVLLLLLLLLLLLRLTNKTKLSNNINAVTILSWHLPDQSSWHEIGYYDLPAMIDFILKKTNQKKLSYIGHSQGTTSFFVMASTRPSYNKKIKIMVALAPVVYMKHLWNPFIQLLSQGHGTIRVKQYWTCVNSNLIYLVFFFFI